MITEIAQIDVKPGTEKDFEAAVAKARPLFLRAKGGKGFELHKSIEKPSRYRLMAKWETLENHTVDFRGSEDFTAWRGLVGPYFALPPEVEHPGGADLRLNARQGYAASGRHRFRRGVVSLEIVDHNLCDRRQRQGERQPPDAEHDAEQDLERK
jgi:heme-degrading monooxygenase HmoA